MAFFKDLEAEIVGVITSVDMAAVPPGSGSATSILTSVQATLRNIVESIKSGSSTQPMPCWFIEFGTFTPERDLGADNLLKRLPIAIYRLEQYGAKQADIHELLTTLALSIDSPGRVLRHFRGSGKRRRSTPPRCRRSTRR
jgi:hypothetical protein